MKSLLIAVAKTLWTLIFFLVPIAIMTCAIVIGGISPWYLTVFIPLYVLFTALGVQDIFDMWEW